MMRSRENLPPNVVAEAFGQYGRNRLWEIIPGALTWSILIGSLFLSLFAPLYAIVFIIIFDFFWMLRVFYFAIHVTHAYLQYHRGVRTDWAAKVAALPRSRDIYHLILLPTYKEEFSILDETLSSLLRAAYPSDRMIIVLGGESRDEQNFRRSAKILEEKYRGFFADLLFTVHPAGLPGEIPGKGSNLRHMASEVRSVIDAKGIPYDNIIVSAFDVDTVAHPQYFAALAYTYLTIPNPTRSSYQPVTVFANNIWTAPAPVRISAFGTTFWLLGELVRPERMWTFSSHSMPWRMLVDVGYHEPDLVSEDSRIFMQGLLRYDGDYRVTPIYLPASMDTVASETYKGSLVDLYKQQRRWAWGVEHIPYMQMQFKKHPNLSRWLKFKYMFNHFEGMITWSCAPLIIFMLGYLPFYTVGETGSALVVNSPYTLEWMMRGATLGVFVTGGLSFMLLPPRPKGTPKSAWLLMLLQWLLMPISFVLFGSFPAIEAQTRLMLGKYLGFNVTKKLASSRVPAPTNTK